MKAKEIIQMGYPEGPLISKARAAAGTARASGRSADQVRGILRALLRDPQQFQADPIFGNLARAVIEAGVVPVHAPEPERGPERTEPLEYAVWGDDIDPAAHEQMRNACRLPVSVAGALMPDAHVGYGLPIGGVLATDNAVIPYAVGVDIACRMMLTVFDLPPEVLREDEARFKKILEQNTRFGIGSEWKPRRDHPVMDEDWRVTPVTAELKDLAHRQLGTSGSGNHFVEFGELELFEPFPCLPAVPPEEQHGTGAPPVPASGTGVSPVNPVTGDSASSGGHGLEARGTDHGQEGRSTSEGRAVQVIPPGRYLAVLSHSGSRGPGARTADHYSKWAMSRHQELPRELRHLAWLDMNSVGAEYWAAMELMGKYASANHHVIHRQIARAVGDPLFQLENHHNFAWKERHRGRDVIVHRKGATPARRGVYGIIPGSMASPGYVVEGLGHPASLDSASHGAGRRMSRKAAMQTYTWSQVKKYLSERGVTLISAGLDEVPFVYKDIDEVMAAQRDLVRPIARFIPRLVKMAPAGERPED